MQKTRVFGQATHDKKERQSPIVGIDVSLLPQAHLMMWGEIIQGICDFGARVVVFKSKNQELHFPQSEKMRIEERDGEKTYYPVDIVVLPSQKLIDQAFYNLAVPVTRSTDGKTRDYDPIAERGNGFYFNHDNKWEIFATIIRAIETYKFPYDWKNLLREIYKMRN